MTVPRLAAWTLLLASGFALTSPISRGQDQPLPSKKSSAVEAMNTYKEQRGIPAGELPAAREHFKAFAKYYADMVSYPLLHKAILDPSIKDPNGRNIPPLDGANGVMADMQRFIMEPLPRSRVTRDNADYIRELGAALDAAFKPIIETHPERVVRINAARMLAAACASGATAHYPTVTALLNSANTPTEIRLYALSAAANLLGAYDVFDYASRRHSNGWNDTPKGAGDKELAALVLAINKHITDPATILNLKTFDPKSATYDQVDVVQFVRRQAIRALGQVRFVAIPGLDGQTLYPAVMLAQVCVSDPVLMVDPSPSECAEAAIGLCNMSMYRLGEPVKGYNADAAAEAVTAALVTFAGPRGRNPLDNSLPWRGYGLRLSDAIKNWGQMFDFSYNPVKAGAYNPDSAPAPIAALFRRAQIALFAPLEKLGIDGKPDLVGGRVDIEDLKLFLKAQRERANRTPLITGVPGTELYMPAKK